MDINLITSWRGKQPCRLPFINGMQRQSKFQKESLVFCQYYNYFLSFNYKIYRSQYTGYYQLLSQQLLLVGLLSTLLPRLDDELSPAPWRVHLSGWDELGIIYHQYDVDPRNLYIWLQPYIHLKCD